MFLLIYLVALNLFFPKYKQYPYKNFWIKENNIIFAFHKT